MSDLLNNQTDLEVDKYYEANDMINAGFNPASVKNKKSVFNTETKTHDVLMPIPSGGYIKIDEESPTKAVIDFNKVYKLIDIDRPELDKSLYAQLIRTTVRKYQEAKGQSKAAKQKREEIAREYIERLGAIK